MKYTTRTTQYTIVPGGKPIFDENATTVQIVDEAAGEFVIVSQDSECIRVEPDDWPHIRAAIDILMGSIHKQDGSATCKKPTQHNPAQLTPEQVGVSEGWRLLDEDEVVSRESDTNNIQGWLDDHNEWGVGVRWQGRDPDTTYRTRLTRKQLAEALNK